MLRRQRGTLVHLMESEAKYDKNLEKNPKRPA